MKKSFFKRKGIKALMWTTGIILFLFIAAQVFLSSYLPGLLRRRVTFLVVNGSDSLYRCSIGKISISLLEGKVVVKDVNISVDSVKFKEMEALGKLPDVTFDATLQEGSVSGLQILPFLFSKKIRLNTIKADNADISIYSQFNAKKEAERKRVQEYKKDRDEKAGKSPEPVSEQDLWKVIEPEIKGIFIKWIFLDHIKFSFRQAGGKDDISVKYDNLSASLKEIRIDSTGAADKNRILFTQDLSMSFYGLKFYTADSLYKLKMDTMAYSSFSKKLIVKGFGVIPNVTPEEFTKRNGQQVDVFEVTVPEITAVNFHIEEVFSDNAIHIDTINVQKPLVNIYHDRTAPPDTVVKYGQYPNEALLKAPVLFRIPTMILFDSEVHYIEKQAVTYKTGNAFFTHVSGVMSNVTNDSTWLEKNSHMTIDMTGNFLHTGKMTASFDFDLGSADGSFTARADLGRMGPEELNIMTIPFGNLKMKTADLKEAHFRLKGDKNGTTGSLRMIYDNLTVDLLMVDKKSHEVKNDKFISWLANLVGVRKDNPFKGKETTADYVHISRTPTMPFFNMIWQTLFGGMKEIMLKGPAKKIKIGQEG